MTIAPWNVISAQQPQNQESSAEAAARKQAELARIERITAEELKSKLSHKEAVFILDVRMPDDYDKAEKKIKGSVRISPFDLKARMNEIPKDKDVVTYCT
jgi:3-mercaptopyruvate sulfurtransferase SseA